MAFSDFLRPIQKTAFSRVGGNLSGDEDRKYINDQINLLKQQNQNMIGEAPESLSNVSQNEIIDSLRYGVDLKNTEIKKRSNDKYHSYDPYYDFIKKNNLSRESFKTLINN